MTKKWPVVALGIGASAGTANAHPEHFPALPESAQLFHALAHLGEFATWSGIILLILGIGIFARNWKR